MLSIHRASSSFRRALCALNREGRVRLALAGMAPALLAGWGSPAAAQPVERVWSNDLAPFRATAVCERSGGGVVVVGADEPGGNPQQLDISAWSSASWATARRRFAVAGFDVRPDAVRELSTGEVLVSGSLHSFPGGGSDRWFIAIFDSALLPVSMIAGGAYSGGPVSSCETATGDLVVAFASVSNIAGKPAARLMLLSRTPSSFTIVQNSRFLTAAGERVTINALERAPNGDILAAGGFAAPGGITGTAMLAAFSPTTLAPVWASGYPEGSGFSEFTGLAFDSTTLYAAGHTQTVSFPNFLTSMRAAAVPLSGTGLLWDAVTTSATIPTGVRLGQGLAGPELWIAGAGPSQHQARLARFNTTGQPLGVTRFRAPELAALTGLALDTSGSTDIPVLVGHWRTGAIAPNPLRGLFVRADQNGTTACSIAEPISATPTGTTPATLAFIDGAPGGGFADFFIEYGLSQGGINACISIGGAPNPYCPGFTACQPPCRVDLNGDGDLNFADVQSFLLAFNDGGPQADIVEDGVLNFADVQAFVVGFNAGC